MQTTNARRDRGDARVFARCAWELVRRALPIVGLCVIEVAAQSPEQTPARTPAQFAARAPAQTPSQAPAGAAAQGASPPQSANGAQEAPRPPIVEFPAEGLSLNEAVRLTIAHAPQIALQEAGLQFQQGVAQEQQGVFDVTLSGSLGYEYRQQELPETRKETEREKRTDLQDAITLNREDYDRARALISQLEVVRGASPGAGQAQAVSAIDPDVGAQLQTLDLLITGQQDAAIRSELFRIRQDFISRKITEINEAATIAVEGFQEGEQRLIDIGAAPDDEVFTNANFDIQMSRRLRNGIVLAPFVTGQFEGTNYKGKARSVDFGGKGLEDLYTFKAGVSTVVPLARGRGAAATGAAERAARIEVDASRATVRHQIAASVFETVRAYWRLKAAQGTVDVARLSLGLQERLLELTRAAIEAGELPAADLARGQASEARARARLFDAERALYEARVNLAIVVGVAVSEDDRTLPRAGDAFPEALAGGAAGEAVGPAANSQLMTNAGAARADLQSATLRDQAGQVLARGAETDRRPRIDIVNDTWWSALDEKTAGHALDRWVGPSTNLRLELERPLGNNAAEGRHAQRLAESRQRAIDATDLRRQVHLAVVRTTQSLRQARGRLEQALVGVEASQATTEAEFERFRAGEATLIDTILTETQLVDARLALVSAQADLATFIAQLRFETASLVRFKESRPMVVETDLRTLPGPESWQQDQPGAAQPPGGGSRR